MRQKPAKKADFTTHEARINKLIAYPKEVLLFNLDFIDGDQLTIAPLEGRNASDEIAIWIQGNIYEGISETVMDLSTTGLSGIVDGITLVAANARDFLIWGFGNNANAGFDGFGFTHKPYSAYTGPATATVGTSVAFTGLTNAYQFVIGARVVVRNTNGTAPLYQWNWGTVTAINSSTSIQVTMDNEVYSTTLTAATGGEIKQWNKFRPYVVASSSQTLFRDHYRLLGETITNTAGNFISAYKQDDPWRPIDPTNAGAIYNGNTPIAATTLYFARDVPIWSTLVDVLVTGNSNAVGQVFQVQKVNGWEQVQIQTVVASQTHRTNGLVSVDGNLSINISANFAHTNFSIFVINYYVPGGMRA
jgi:hypothetical protein